MNHNLTNEQLTERFNKACARYVEIRQALEEVEKEFAHLGIEFVSSFSSLECFNGSKKEHPCAIQVYRGLKQIEKASGIKMEYTSDCFGRKDENQKGIDVNGIGFFQLGTPTKRSYKWR